MALQFEQVAGTALYEVRAQGSVGWSGYVLPTGATAPAQIPIGESLTRYGGSYLFAWKRPPAVDADPAELARQANVYVQANARTNRAAVWLQGVDPVVFGTYANYGFSFSYDPINRRYPTRSNLNVRLGTNLGFFVLQDLSVTVDEDRGTLNVVKRKGQAPFIGFDDGRSDPGIRVQEGQDERARVPFAGPGTGCFTFQATIAPAVAFAPNGLQAGFRYAAKTADGLQLVYPALNVPSLPASLGCAGTVDPSDPANLRLASADLLAGILRTGFALAGAPQLASTFRTAEGIALSLVPLGTPAGATAPTPGAGALALAWAGPVTSTPLTAKAYLVPAGAFAAAAAGRDPGVGQELLCGLFGSERITFATYDPQAAANDAFVFVPSQPAYAPVFPFTTASLQDPASGAVRARLDGTWATSWASLASAAAPRYRAEPEGSGLYATPSPATRNAPAGAAAPAEGETPILWSAPPSLPLPLGTAHAFPLVPYAGTAPATPDAAARLTGFESQILAPTRKSVVSAGAAEAWRARGAARLLAVTGGADTRATPQGFVATVDAATDAYLNVKLAQSPDAANALVPFAFDRPTQAVQDALQTNQLCLVAVNPAPFTGGGARFDNRVFVATGQNPQTGLNEVWTMAAQVGRGASATSYRNVMILKFCSGSLLERVRNPNQWTDPAGFSLLPDAAGPGAETVAYTGLSQWLQGYLLEGIARADGPSAEFYRDFKAIVTDPEWNGVIVLQADLSADDLPFQIRGLAAGIDLTRFTAHHFGFTVSRVKVEGSTVSMDGNSAVFGLIDYEDPSYAANVAAGVNPDSPIPVEAAGDFAFTVLQLQSLFRNARLVDFKSRVQLTVERLFGAEVGLAYSGGIPQAASAVVLPGSYVDQNGTASYVFEQDTRTVFTLDGNVLQALAFNRVQFNTLGERDGGATVASRFLVWGAFDFVELADTSGALFDILSFGSPAETPPERLGAGLAFSNLVIGMAFPAATPNATSFAVDTANLAYDLSASQARPESLFRGFGLQLKSFLNAQGGQTPADVGFLPVTTRLNLKKLADPWFGVVYEVTLGGPGALASAAGFTSNLLLAWSPATKAGDAARALFTGLSLPGAAPGARLFSVQGVFKVGVGSIALQRQQVPQSDPPRHYYTLRLDDIGIRIFGIAKLPPSATIRFFLFGDPGSTGSLAWYAAYVADQPAAASAALPAPRAPETVL